MIRHATLDIETKRRLSKREAGDVPEELMRLEVLVEQISAEDGARTGEYQGHVVAAHGWDEYGTYVYRESKKKRGMRCKEYKWFPTGRDVIINEVPR